jgi:hypothetical protein
MNENLLIEMKIIYNSNYIASFDPLKLLLSIFFRIVRFSSFIFSAFFPLYFYFFSKGGFLSNYFIIFSPTSSHICSIIILIMTRFISFLIFLFSPRRRKKCSTKNYLFLYFPLLSPSICIQPYPPQPS